MFGKNSAVPDTFRWITPAEFADIAIELGMTPEEVLTALIPKEGDLAEKDRDRRPTKGPKRNFKRS